MKNQSEKNPTIRGGQEKKGGVDTYEEDYRAIMNGFTGFVLPQWSKPTDMIQKFSLYSENRYSVASTGTNATLKN